MFLFSRIKQKMDTAAEEKERKKAEEAEGQKRLSTQIQVLEARIDAGDATAAEELIMLYGGEDRVSLFTSEQMECLKKGAKLGSEYCKEIFFRYADRLLQAGIKWGGGSDHHYEIHQFLLEIYDINDSEFLKYITNVERSMGVACWNNYKEYGSADSKTNAYKWLKQAAKHGDEDADAMLHTMF